MLLPKTILMFAKKVAFFNKGGVAYALVFQEPLK